MFLFVFSFQVLPVKTLGKLLAKGQTEEEVKHDCSGDDCGDDAVKYLDFVCGIEKFTSTEQLIQNRASYLVHRSAMLPPSYIGEILSPPPNL